MNTDVKTQVSQFPTAAVEARDAITQEAVRFGELARAWWQRNADLARDTAGAVRDQAAAFGSRTRLYVKDEPVKSVLVAAALGAAVTGLLMMFMKRDN